MEVFGYFIGFFSFIITILAGVLTYLAWSNAKWIKAAHAETMELIKKMDETIEKLGEKISQLIVADGEKTRELVREFKTGPS